MERLNADRRAAGLEVSPTKETPPPTFETDRQQAESDHYLQLYRDLNSRYKKAIKELSIVDRLVSRVESLAPRSYNAAPSVPVLRKTTGRPQSALLQFSDTHVGCVVRPNQTLGFGGYSWPIFLNRLAYLEDAIKSILTEHVGTKIDRLVVAMLGDMLHGNLSHANEAAHVNNLFMQFYGASHAVAQFLRNLSTIVPEITIKTVVGNHPRWANQRKMPTVNRNSNLDQFFYAMVQSLVRDIPKIQFDLDMQPMAEFKIYDFKFLAAHGDHWRGGDKALGIPAHAMGRELSAKSQMYAAAGRSPVNYWLTGQLHKEIQVPHANGSILVNGGFPGADTYGIMENFTPVDPTQRFSLVHPSYGMTAQYSLTLKHAKDGQGLRYKMPASLELE
mgnify:CR=1 FL=1